MSERIICPTCGKPIDSEDPLWVLLGKWYCTEKCARIAATTGGVLR